MIIRYSRESGRSQSEARAARCILCCGADIPDIPVTSTVLWCRYESVYSTDGLD